MENKQIKMDDVVDNKEIKIKNAIENLKNKKNKFLFCVPNIQQPTASMYEIYFHANALKNEGLSVYMLTEDKNHKPPSFIESALVDNLSHHPMDKSNISVGPDDFMIIPETLTTVMEQTKNLPCNRIVLLQSFDYMLNSLVTGITWRDFNIRDVITTSDTLKNMIDEFFGKNIFNVKTYSVGIPDYFCKPTKPKKPIISIIGRNSNDISKIVKLFYTKYPQFGWITFDPMLTNKKPPEPLNRLDFAERLKNNFAAVWVDRISSFGTFPLECLLCETIPICLKPDITPDYIYKDSKTKKVVNEYIGFWTMNFYDIPTMINDVITNFLEDGISDDYFDNSKKTLEKYTQENSKKEILTIYGKYVNERITILEEALKTIKNE